MRIKAFKEALQQGVSMIGRLASEELSMTGKVFHKANRRRMYFTLAGASIGSYVYQQFINNDLEVIYQPTEYNTALLQAIEAISCGKYWGSPTLFLRCMEIIYGNTLDKRANTVYDREILYAPDGENLALGMLTRLAVRGRDSSGRRARQTGGSDTSRTHRRVVLSIHHVSSKGPRRRSSQATGSG